MLDVIARKIFGNKWLAWFWTFLVVLACVWPGKDIPEAPMPGFDKIVHAGLFTTWTVLWLCIFPANTKWVVIAGIFLALGTEICQDLLPIDRTFDWLDALTDAAGIFLGWTFKNLILDRYLQRLY